MILPNKRTTMALNSLRRCPGWSAPLLFANSVDRFSRVEAHMINYAWMKVFRIIPELRIFRSTLKIQTKYRIRQLIKALIYFQFIYSQVNYKTSNRLLIICIRIFFAPVFSFIYCLVLIFALSPFYILIYMF